MVLHLVTTWRSRDAYAAWPLNAAACCLWLVRAAEKLGMAVGTYTDISYSLHVYARDWKAAQDVVEGYDFKGTRWDPRTVWRVDLVNGPCSCGSPGVMHEDRCAVHGNALRATAYAAIQNGARPPGEGEVVGVFEAPGPERLRHAIAESGLVQEPSAWLWLGAEIEKTWRKP